MIPLKNYGQEDWSAAEVVDDFFARLTLLLNNVSDIEFDKPAVVGYLAGPGLRDAHTLVALSDIASYSSVMEDVLLTATKLCEEPSIVSQELLLDWATTAPEFALERLKPDAWLIIAHVMEAWDTGASNNSTTGFFYNAAC